MALAPAIMRAYVLLWSLSTFSGSLPMSPSWTSLSLIRKEGVLSIYPVHKNVHTPTSALLQVCSDDLTSCTYVTIELGFSGLAGATLAVLDCTCLRFSSPSLSIHPVLRRHIT